MLAPIHPKEGEDGWNDFSPTGQAQGQWLVQGKNSGLEVRAPGVCFCPHPSVADSEFVFSDLSFLVCDKCGGCMQALGFPRSPPLTLRAGG